MNWARHHRNFLVFLAVFVVASTAAAISPPEPRLGTPLMFGFDLAAIVYLAITLPGFSRMDPDAMRQRAIATGSNVRLLVIAGAVIVVVVMIALASELIDSGPTSVAISAITLLLAWIFLNGLFLMHYAQVYYTQIDGSDAGGLQFAGNHPDPDVWDLAYFAFTMAIIFSVSDVVITSRHLRRIALAHGLLAFTFNIFAIGMSIGLIGNLFM